MLTSNTNGISKWRWTLLCALLITFILPGKAVSGTGDPAQALDQQLREIARLNNLDGTPEGYVDIPDPMDALPTLGKALFFSKQLSGERDVACVSCHHPLLAGADGLSLGVGIAAHDPNIVGPGRIVDLSRDGDPKAKSVGGPNVPRNALTTFNSGLYLSTLMHDGRISIMRRGPGGEPLYRTPESTLRSSPDMNAMGDLLAVQARFPVTGFEEMRGFGEFYSLTGAEIRDAIASRIRDSGNWLRSFEIAFRRPGDSAEELITFDNIAEALAAYQRSQTFIDSPWRRYLGGASDAIDQHQKEGAVLFFTSPEDGGYGCSGCHRGDFFSDESAHVTGTPQLGRGKRADGDDPGLFLVTQDRGDEHKFRTPTLLNVSESGPWGHSGSFVSLQAFIKYHANPKAGSESFDFNLRHLPQFALATAPPYPEARALTARVIEKVSPLLPGITPTERDAERLVSFLKTLTDPCTLSRECLQPWIAGSQDDFDGHLLQPVFKQSETEGPFPTEIRTVAVATGPAAQMMPLPAVLAETDMNFIADLSACNQVAPVSKGAGEHRFVDRTKALGIDHIHHVPGRMWYGQKYSYAVEFAMQSAAVVAGDINNDCWPDLLFATHNGEKAEVVAYLNRLGDGFDKETLPLKGIPDAIGALGLVDLNGDFELDLVVGNMFGARETAVFTASPDERFKLQQKISMSKVVFGFAFGDYDGDGWIDGFAAHWDVAARPAFAPALMQNRGGYLLPADEPAGTTGADLEQNFHFSPAFVDFDGDGHTDLVIASDFGTSEVLRNKGDGRFQVITDHGVITDENGMGSAIGDFNNDGLLDWFVTSIYKFDDGASFNWGKSGNRLYMGQGSGLEFFDNTDAANVRDGAWAWGTCAADFNSDGWLDLFVENGFGMIPSDAASFVPEYIATFVPESLKSFHKARPRLFINQGDGTFRDEALAWGFEEETNGRGVICFDHNRDGAIDIVVTQNSDSPRLYENMSAGVNGSHFIGFQLIGGAPNTSAVGASIAIEAGGMSQLRHVQMNSNYQSQNPTTIHFGLGNAAKVDKVTVRWPDGIEEQLGPIEANRYYPLLHPSLRGKPVDLAERN